MVQIIPKSKRKFHMFDEMSDIYDGKWVFISNAEMSDEDGLVGGHVAVVADWPYEELDSGVYSDIELNGGGICVDFYFLNDDEDECDDEW